MSKRKKKDNQVLVPIRPYIKPCICSLPQVTILILIILQFSNKGPKSTGSEDEYSQIGNEILFIIALYFLSCIECSYRYSYSIDNMLIMSIQ